jgi:hypothetical protein
MSLKFQHHNVPLITLLKEMVTCSTLLCTRLSGWQKSLSLTLWTHITSQPFSTCWRPCDIHQLGISLKLRKACWLDDIPKECLRYLLRRPLVHLTYLFNHCLRLSHFPNLLSTTGKLFEKVTLTIFQRHIGERGLLNASQFRFRAVTTRHFNVWGLRTMSPYISTIITIIFLDIENAFDTTWYIGLLYKLSKLKFSFSLFNLISSFISKKNSESRSKMKCLRQKT